MDNCACNGIAVELTPLTLYVHVPWCVRKCPYCDFNSFKMPEPIPEARFIDVLLRDLEQELAQIATKRALGSIFIGGGTPSLLSGAGVARLLASIKTMCFWDADVEITLEANPGTIDTERFCAYREAGVNRLSIGVQSFNPEQLQALGRIHSADEAYQAVASARAAGFTNLNLDLMFGLPGQTVRTAMRDLAQTLDLRPEHLSWYQLTVEPHTAFFRAPPQLPNEERIWAIQQQGQEFLAAKGFMQYEVSAYAYAANKCRHNLNYWRFGDYLGIGPGAHGKLTSSSGQVRRTRKFDNPRTYLAGGADGPFAAETQILQEKDLFEEFLLNALRLREGFAWDLFEARTGLDRKCLAAGLAAAESRGLIVTNGEWVRATAQGYSLLNQLLLLFCH